MTVQEIISSGLLELYATGQATEAEQKQVQGWLLQYPEVASELNAIEKSLEEYALSNAVAPAPHIKEKIFVQLQPKEANQKSTASSSAKTVTLNRWKWAAAASVILLAGSAILNYSLYNKAHTANTKLAETKLQLSMAQLAVREMKEDISVVQNPNSIPVSLSGLPQTPNAKAKIFWISNTGEVMIDASNLPDAPAGKQYQFWAIVDGLPVNGGLIITNDKGKKIRMQKMKSFGRAEAFAISLENEGGNPTPTTVVSMGSI